MSNAKPVWKPVPEQIEEMTLRLPAHAMQALRQMAKYLEIPCDTLVRRYISRGLRDDQTMYFMEHAFSTIEESLQEQFGEDPRVREALVDARASLGTDVPAPPRTRTRHGNTETPGS